MESLEKRLPARHTGVNFRSTALTCREAVTLKRLKKQILRLHQMRGLVECEEEKINGLIKILEMKYISIAFQLPLARPIRVLRMRVDLDSFSDNDIKRHFRFQNKSQIVDLLSCFQIPVHIKLENGAWVSNVELLLLSLYRLHYPTNFLEIQQLFHRDYSICNRAFNFFVRFMVERWGYLLTNNLNYWLCDSFLSNFANKIASQMTADVPPYSYLVDNQYRICAFIDTTSIRVDRPGGDKTNQASVYSGYKKIHGIKFQSVILPNGMDLFVDGPYSARNHDSIVLSESQFLSKFETILKQKNLKYRIHGDPAYGTLYPYLSSGDISKLRICVEWEYREDKSYFSLITHKESMKLRKTPVGSIILLSFLFRNAYTALNGSQISARFDCDPPSLQEWTAKGPV